MADLTFHEQYVQAREAREVVKLRGENQRLRRLVLQLQRANAELVTQLQRTRVR